MEKTKTVAINIPLPEDLLSQVREAAQADDRTITATVRVALREFLASRQLVGA